VGRARRRFVVDNIHDAEVWMWDPFKNREPRVTSTAERVGALGLRGETGLVLALETSFALMDGRSGDVEVITRLEGESPTTRLNDGRVYPAGRFVCGGMDEGRPQRPVSAVYSLERDLTTRQLLSGVSCANSLCWNGDGRTLYFADIPCRRIEAFGYDVLIGALSNRLVRVRGRRAGSYGRLYCRRRRLLVERPMGRRQGYAVRTGWRN
jgi:L-arabinonolactonase